VKPSVKSGAQVSQSFEGGAYRKPSGAKTTLFAPRIDEVLRQAPRRQAGANQKIENAST
jgi:hypothetical protein